MYNRTAQQGIWQGEEIAFVINSYSVISVRMILVYLFLFALPTQTPVE